MVANISQAGIGNLPEATNLSLTEAITSIVAGQALTDLDDILDGAGDEYVDVRITHAEVAWLKKEFEQCIQPDTSWLQDCVVGHQARKCGSSDEESRPKPTMKPERKRNNRKWRPLHVCIAWALTRDQEFCAEIAEDGWASASSFSLAARLEQELMEAGCFEIREETIQVDQPSNTVTFKRHRLRLGYAGRFKALAEDYENGGRDTFTSTIENLPHSPGAFDGIVNLGDFLLGEWHDSFFCIAARISDGDIQARGVRLDGDRRLTGDIIHAASFTESTWMDVDGKVWEGPKAQYGEQPRRWDNITLEWAGVLKCFPKFRKPTLSERKRLATNAAIQEFGIKELSDMGQKLREQAIIERVRTRSKLSVKERFVRDRFTEARKSGA